MFRPLISIKQIIILFMHDRYGIQTSFEERLLLFSCLQKTLHYRFNNPSVAGQAKRISFKYVWIPYKITSYSSVINFSQFRIIYSHFSMTSPVWRWATLGSLPVHNSKDVLWTDYLELYSIIICSVMLPKIHSDKLLLLIILLIISMRVWFAFQLLHFAKSTKHDIISYDITINILQKVHLLTGSSYFP